ncbi:unnamed protein product, partial [Coregonus sp. 'balchen']
MLVPGLEKQGLVLGLVLGLWAWETQEPGTGDGAGAGLGSVEGRKDNLRRKQTHKGALDPEVNNGGVIRTALANMDREAREHYAVVIQAKDMAGSVGGLSGSTTINITLTDVNDNPPKFPQIGKIKANDEDLGVNAAIKYSIINSEGAAMFSIATDRDTREGIISLKKPLNYERKKTYTLHIEGVNTHVEPRFSYLGPFKDTATLKITVGDVDEPPVFSMDYYIMDVYENARIGTE